MKRKCEASIQKQIRKRAFERADILRQERQNALKTRHTLDALQEVTGLHRPELECIADEVTRSVQMANDGFFSIKNQILMVFGAATLIVILSGFVYII
jgi:hypothetical protein